MNISGLYALNQGYPELSKALPILLKCNIGGNFVKDKQKNTKLYPIF